MKTLTSMPLPASSRLFCGLTDNQSLGLMHSLGAVAVSYGKGETIIRQWSPITHYYVIVSGEVHSYCTYEDGRRSVNGAFYNGDVFGLTFAFSDMRRQPSAGVAIRDTVVIRIPIVDIINDMTLVSTDVSRRYLQNTVNVISQAAYKARLRAFVVAQKSVEGRIMTYLIEKSKHFHANEFDIPFDRQELADFLDCDRCSVSKVLSRLQKRGSISYEKNHFRVKSAVLMPERRQPLRP